MAECTLAPNICLMPTPGSSRVSNGPLCNFCKKCDPIALKKQMSDSYEGLNSEIDAEREYAVDDELAIDEHQKTREAERRNAMNDGKLVCALQNPRFFGQDWRKASRPRTPRPCVLLDAKGADEGRLCTMCQTYEIPEDSDWANKFVVRPSEKYPYARIKFTCIWLKKRGQDPDFRDNRDQPWSDDCRMMGTYTKYPDAVCEWHKTVFLGRYAPEYASNGYYHREKFPEFVWNDGRLKTTYPDEPVAPTVPGDVLEAQWQK